MKTSSFKVWGLAIMAGCLLAGCATMQPRCYEAVGHPRFVGTFCTAGDNGENMAHLTTYKRSGKGGELVIDELVYFREKR